MIAFVVFEIDKLVTHFILCSPSALSLSGLIRSLLHWTDSIC